MNSLIGVIDNGVFLNFFNNLSTLAESISIDSDCNIKMSSRERWLTHGTICASIIKEYAPASEIVSICLKPRRNVVTVEQLITAIDFLDKLNVELINISVGIVCSDLLPELNSIIKNFSDKNRIIVAAGNNYGFRSYPSFFQSVIGVAQLNDHLTNSCGFVIHSSSITGINYLANGIHKLKQRSGEYFITPNASSFATPYITSYVYNLLHTKSVKGVSAVHNALNEALEQEIHTTGNGI